MADAFPGLRLASVHHIHGTRDWVILPSRVKPDVWVQGGAHLLNMSHPVEVNRWIAEGLAAAVG